MKPLLVPLDVTPDIRRVRHTLAQEVECGSWPKWENKGLNHYTRLHSLERNFSGISNELDRLKHILI